MIVHISTYWKNWEKNELVVSFLWFKVLGVFIFQKSLLYCLVDGGGIRRLLNTYLNETWATFIIAFTIQKSKWNVGQGKEYCYIGYSTQWFTCWDTVFPKLKTTTSLVYIICAQIIIPINECDTQSIDEIRLWEEQTNNSEISPTWYS